MKAPAALGTMSRDARERATVVLAVGAVFVLLALASMRQGAIGTNYLAGAGQSIALFALFALGLGLQFGLGGLVNFGHAGFALVGAYGVGIAHLQGWPLPLGIALGLAGAVAFALLAGVPSLRLREDYLAIVTIGLAEILRIVASSEVALTRGPLGIYSFPRPGLEFATAPGGSWAGFAGALGVQPYLLFIAVLAAALAGLVYLAFARLAASPWGRALRAVRDDEDVAGALGKDPFKLKLQALALGAVPAAMFGMAFAWAHGQIVPDNYATQVTFNAWIILVLGGVGNLRGAVVGSAVFWAILLVPQAADVGGVPIVGTVLGFLTKAGPGQLMLIGLLLIVMMMFRPQGMVGRKEEMLFAK